MIRWLGPLAALALLAGCADSARDVEYTQERGISADIAASHATGPTLYPGETVGGEPLGAFPWTLDQH
jgi:hypothetical protein